MTLAAGNGVTQSSAADLKSRRTLLSPFVGDDLEQLLAVFQNADVRRFLLDDSLVSREWVQSEIAASAERFSESGSGLWAVRLKTHTPIIGFAGFREFFEPPQLQLLYGLLPGYWGQGLATEAATAVCDHAFQTLHLPKIQAAIDTPNAASRRVLKRLGMQLVKTTPDDESGTEFYLLTREDWKRPQGIDVG